MIEIKMETTKDHTHTLRYIFRQGMYPDPEFEDFKDRCHRVQAIVGWENFSYFAPTKAWVFSKPSLGHILDQFPEAGINEIIAYGVPEPEPVKVTLDTSGITLPDEIVGTPYPYQMEALAFLEQNNGRGILAMEMGTGKTLCAIAFTRMLKKRAIVICPSTVKVSWEEEIKKWAPSCTYKIMSAKDTLPQQPVDFLILNYELLKKFHLGLGDRKEYEVVIVDEMHYMKNPNTQRTKYILKLDRPYRILLSGTPMLNSPIELFPALHYMNEERFKNFYAFGYKYCNAHNVSKFGRQIFEAGEPSPELLKVVPQYMFRKLKSEVLDQLPPKIINQVGMYLTPSQNKRYQTALEEYFEYLLSRYSGDLDAGSIYKRYKAEDITKLMELKKIIAEFKVPTTIGLARDAIEDGNKILIFTQFRSVVEDIKDSFGDEAVMLYGSTPDMERKSAIQSFQNNPNVKIFVATTRSGGIGITLTEASVVIFNDLGWTPAEHDQAIDRAHRIGSEKHDAITVLYPIIRMTIDDIIIKILDKKRTMINQVIDGGKAPEKEMHIYSELAVQLMKTAQETLDN